MILCEIIVKCPMMFLKTNGIASMDFHFKRKDWSSFGFALCCLLQRVPNRQSKQRLPCRCLSKSRCLINLSFINVGLIFAFMLIATP